ncbi:MAG: Zn-ribbon domain-containing OB-fold protein [Candidatus Lokiarchaeota archaeon]|nr:Zn-ribbon domain-containing OB-fold protein [Candidatus Lokiarchaeota archaeon]
MAHVSVPKYWHALGQKYRLVAGKCSSCGTLNFPPTPLCKSCNSTDTQQEVRLKGKGKIYSYTVIGRGAAPPEFTKMQKKSGPYAIAVIELEEGQKVNAQLTDLIDPYDIKIGDEVIAVFRQIYEQEDVIRYGLKFRPVIK